MFPRSNTFTLHTHGRAAGEHHTRARGGTQQPLRQNVVHNFRSLQHSRVPSRITEEAGDSDVSEAEGELRRRECVNFSSSERRDALLRMKAEMLQATEKQVEMVDPRAQAGSAHHRVRDGPGAGLARSMSFQVGFGAAGRNFGRASVPAPTLSFKPMYATTGTQRRSAQVSATKPNLLDVSRMPSFAPFPRAVSFQAAPAVRMRALSDGLAKATSLSVEVDPPDGRNQRQDEAEARAAVGRTPGSAAAEEADNTAPASQHVNKASPPGSAVRSKNRLAPKPNGSPGPGLAASDEEGWHRDVPTHDAASMSRSVSASASASAAPSPASSAASGLSVPPPRSHVLLRADRASGSGAAQVGDDGKHTRDVSDSAASDTPGFVRQPRKSSGARRTGPVPSNSSSGPASSPRPAASPLRPAALGEMLDAGKSQLQLAATATAFSSPESNRNTDASPIAAIPAVTRRSSMPVSSGAGTTVLAAGNADAAQPRRAQARPSIPATLPSIPTAGGMSMNFNVRPLPTFSLKSRGVQPSRATSAAPQDRPRPRVEQRQPLATAARPAGGRIDAKTVSLGWHTRPLLTTSVQRAGSSLLRTGPAGEGPKLLNAKPIVFGALKTGLHLRPPVPGARTGSSPTTAPPPHKQSETAESCDPHAQDKRRTAGPEMQQRARWPPPLQVGGVVPIGNKQYKLLSLLGQGAYGAVFCGQRIPELPELATSDVRPQGQELQPKATFEVEADGSRSDGAGDADKAKLEDESGSLVAVKQISAGRGIALPDMTRERLRFEVACLSQLQKAWEPAGRSHVCDCQSGQSGHQADSHVPVPLLRGWTEYAVDLPAAAVPNPATTGTGKTDETGTVIRVAMTLVPGLPLADVFTATAAGGASPPGAEKAAQATRAEAVREIQHRVSQTCVLQDGDAVRRDNTLQNFASCVRFVAQMLAQLAAAMAVVERGDGGCNAIHRDLNLRNILVARPKPKASCADADQPSSSWRFSLVDFGSATPADAWRGGKKSSTQAGGFATLPPTGDSCHWPPRRWERLYAQYRPPPRAGSPVPSPSASSAEAVPSASAFLSFSLAGLSLSPMMSQPPSSLLSPLLNAMSTTASSAPTASESATNQEPSSDPRTRARSHRADSAQSLQSMASTRTTSSEIVQAEQRSRLLHDDGILAARTDHFALATIAMTLLRLLFRACLSQSPGPGSPDGLKPPQEGGELAQDATADEAAGHGDGVDDIERLVTRWGRYESTAAEANSKLFEFSKSTVERPSDVALQRELWAQLIRFEAPSKLADCLGALLWGAGESDGGLDCLCLRLQRLAPAPAPPAEEGSVSSEQQLSPPQARGVARFLLVVREMLLPSSTSTPWSADPDGDGGGSANKMGTYNFGSWENIQLECRRVLDNLDSQ